MAFRRGAQRAPQGTGPDVPAGYTDVQQLARGGFAVVYRAHDERFDRTVALKVLTLDGLDERILRRFRAECMATGRVSAHPHIVTVYDAGTTPGHRPWLSMEFCSGGTMADRVEREGAMKVADVLDAGGKLASALQAAHGAGILHRDVKPQNVLVTAYGEPQLADFGIARVTTEGDAMTQTAAFTVVHSAPEILEGADATVPSDVYSLASTLYSMLAGRAAYAREASIGLAPLVTRILRGEVPPLARDDLPAGLEDLLRAALSSDPARRPQSAAELAGGLAACAVRSSSGPGRPPVRPATSPAPQAPSAPVPAPADDVAARAEQVASGLAAGGVTDAASTHAVGSGQPDTPASAGLPAPGTRPASLTGPGQAPAGRADLTHRRGDLDGLGAIVAGAPAGTAAPPPVPGAPTDGTASPEPARRRRGLLPVLVSAGAVAVLGTAVGVVWGVANGRDDPAPQPSVTVTGSVAPDAGENAPRDLTVRAAEGRLEVSWTLPDEAVTPLVRAEPEVGDALRFAPGQTEVTLYDVEPGTSYCFSLSGIARVDGEVVSYPPQGEPVCGTPL